MHTHIHTQILHKDISLGRRRSLVFGVRHARIQIPLHHSTILLKFFVSSLPLPFTPSLPLSISPLIPPSFLLFFLPFWITEPKNLSGTPNWERGPGLAGVGAQKWVKGVQQGQDTRYTQEDWAVGMLKRRGASLLTTEGNDLGYISHSPWQLGAVMCIMKCGLKWYRH